MFPPRSSLSVSKSRDPDDPIRETDNDASLARLPAVQRGYLTNDPFVRYFVPRAAHLQSLRPSLINIGTYVRSESIDRLVDAWLQLCEEADGEGGGRKCQIASLGAGSDTRFWRLAISEHCKTIAKYIEIDFQGVTTKKGMAIKKNKELITALGDPSAVSLANRGTPLRPPVYNLLAADLRQPPQNTLGPLLAASTPSALTLTPTSTSAPESGTSPVLDPSTPTLLLFECVLAYMEPRESDAVIAWFADYFRHGKDFGKDGKAAPLGAIVYEMFGLGDAFGRVMKNNLQARSVTLPGCTPYPTLSSLPARFARHNFSLLKALTLKEIKYSRIPADEIQRISQIEMLGEVEELYLVLDHYAITWGAIWPDHDGDGPSKAKWWGWDLKWDDAGATSGD